MFKNGTVCAKQCAGGNFARTQPEMTAHFAQIFECKDGKIYRQRNYDCFEPF